MVRSSESDLAEYMKEHVYMYSSETVHVTFRIVKPMITDVIDMFGKDVIFSNEDETRDGHDKDKRAVNAAVCEKFCARCRSVKAGEYEGETERKVEKSSGSVSVDGG